MFVPFLRFFSSLFGAFSASSPADPFGVPVLIRLPADLSAWSRTIIPYPAGLHPAGL